MSESHNYVQVDPSSAANWPTPTVYTITTSNGPEPLTYDRAKWLQRSRQRKRHPLDPMGVCMTCGDHKMGHWEWVSEEPE